MSEQDPPSTGTVTVDFDVKIGQCRLSAKASMPAGPLRLAEMLPIIQRVADAIVDSSVQDVEAAGRKVTCAAGCGACCRQLVPISEVEARNIAQLVEQMPEPRRTHVRARFADARARLAKSGMWDLLEHRQSWDEDVFVDIGMQYFQQGVPCPFLEDESCSIHSDRPITCREYLVTSPAANCAHPRKDNIDRVELPIRIWTGLARFDPLPPPAKYCRWVPLVMAPEWSAAHAEERAPQPGPEMLREFLENLAEGKGDREQVTGDRERLHGTSDR